MIERREAAAWLLGAVIILFSFQAMLFSGSATLRHDNLVWGLPLYQYWADNVAAGFFPYWNPYSHGGEPLYPLAGHVRLLEPLSYAVLFAGRLFTSDAVLLYNWNRIIQSFTMLFGVYLVLRRFTGRLAVRLSLVPILLFSSFMLGSFEQDGVLLQFLWVPAMTYLMLRIACDGAQDWHLWLLLGAATGLNWSSYFFSGPWTFLLFFAGGLCLFRRDAVAAMVQDRRFAARFSVMAAVILAMLAPGLAVMGAQEGLVFPIRMLDLSWLAKAPIGAPQWYEGDPASIVPPLKMSYSFIEHTGSSSTLWDFLQMLRPGGDPLRPGWPAWGKPSEAFIYLGALPWAIGIFGLFFGRDRLKRVWLFVLVGFALLLLGPAGGLHRLLFPLYPPLWFLRNTHALVLFFEFAFLYFYVIGFNRLLEPAPPR